MNVMITGASRGIGRALAFHYLIQGETVAAVVRRCHAAHELRQRAAALRGNLYVYHADVSDAQAMRDVVRQIEQEVGAIHLAIANAGIGDQRLSSELDAKRFSDVFLTNTIGVANTFDPVLPGMRQRGDGQLVAIASLAAITPLPRIGTYGASKAALTYAMESLYWELRPQGIDVTTVCPGFVDTDMLRGHGVPGFWTMSQAKAVAQIVEAIENKVRIACFPFWVYALLRMIRALPDVAKGPVFSRVFPLLFPSPNSSHPSFERSKPS